MDPEKRKAAIRAATGALVRNSVLPEWLQIVALGQDMSLLAELVVDELIVKGILDVDPR
jgi:hypothetical protein